MKINIPSTGCSSIKTGLLRESQNGGLAVLLQHEKVGEAEFLRKCLEGNCLERKWYFRVVETNVVWKLVDTICCLEIVVETIFGLFPIMRISFCSHNFVFTTNRDLSKKPQKGQWVMYSMVMFDGRN